MHPIKVNERNLKAILASTHFKCRDRKNPMIEIVENRIKSIQTLDNNTR